MRYIYMLPAAFFVPVIHEWVKAMVSTALGDPTPRERGYLTLNPFRYFEPIGFLFVLIFGYGWGNPTPTAALHYRDRQKGIIITYVTPVLVNLLLGIGAVIGVNILINAHFSHVPYNMFFFFLHASEWTTDIYTLSILLLSHFAFVNINIALFNLIPVYPLAANKLLLLFSQPDNIARFTHYEKPMQVGMVLMLAFGIIGSILHPIAQLIIRASWGIGV